MATRNPARQGDQAGAASPVRPLAGRPLALALLAWAIISLLAIELTQRYLRYAEGVVVAQIGEDLLSSAKAQQQNLLRTLEAVVGLHALVQTRRELALQDNEAGAAALGARIISAAEEERFGIIQIAEIDRDGMLAWSTVPDWKPVDLSDREHFQLHRQGQRAPFVSTPLVGRTSGRWSVQITLPLIEEGRFAGVFVASLDPLLLSRTLAEIHQRSQEIVSVIRSLDGAIMARSEGLGEYLQNQSPRYGALLERARRADSGYFRAVSADDHRDSIIAFQRLAEAPIIVVVRQPWQVGGQNFQNMRRWAQGSLASGVLFGLVAVLLTLQIHGSRRMTALLRATRAEAEATRAAWSRLDQLMANAPAVIYLATVGPQATVMREPVFTRNLRDIAGWDEAALTAPGGFTAQLDAAGRLARRRFLGEVLRDGHSRVEYRFRRADGQWVWLREEANVVRRLEDAVQICGYFTDATQERMLEAQAIAAAKLATLGEMAAGIAHELNQPLLVIALAAGNSREELQEGGAEAVPAAVETLSLIGRQTRRCKEIVEHLRHFARPDSSEELVPVALAEVLEGALLLTEAVLREAGITLTLAVPQELPRFLGRMVAAEQVLVNLLLNARDVLAAQPAARPRHIRLAAEATPEAVLVSVTDSGGGIAPELLDRIFEPFFTTKGPDKGTGLGLSICHGIMTSFGGTISAGNAAEGASFLLRFRRAPGSTPA
ncbi:ATP-binding protein [Roseomonas sp. USHLN139]|uniref:ATP-binding protein n=1 Tax=Roseomonas sp. USHLN139 TaxID=3081298 RepID=UPI003B019CC3